MKTLLTSALIVASLSGAAFAASPAVGADAGKAQLALTAGVEPGRYTTEELINIIEAKRDNDAAKVNYYLSGANRGSEAVTGGAGADQFARSLGVEPGRFTLAELIQLDAAKRENDPAAINFVLSGKNRQGDTGQVTPGKAQLAALAGVNAADYTRAELIALQPSIAD